MSEHVRGVVATAKKAPVTVESIVVPGAERGVPAALQPRQRLLDPVVVGEHRRDPVESVGARKILGQNIYQLVGAALRGQLFLQVPDGERGRHAIVGVVIVQVVGIIAHRQTDGRVIHDLPKSGQPGLTECLGVRARAIQEDLPVAAQRPAGESFCQLNGFGPGLDAGLRVQLLRIAEHPADFAIGIVDESESTFDHRDGMLQNLDRGGSETLRAEGFDSGQLHPDPVCERGRLPVRNEAPDVGYPVEPVQNSRDVDDRLGAGRLLQSGAEQRRRPGGGDQFIDQPCRRPGHQELAQHRFREGPGDRCGVLRVRLAANHPDSLHHVARSE